MKNHEKSKKTSKIEKNAENDDFGRFPRKTVILGSIKGEKRTKTPKKRTFGPENELAIFEKKKKSSTEPQTGLL